MASEHAPVLSATALARLINSARHPSISIKKPEKSQPTGRRHSQNLPRWPPPAAGRSSVAARSNEALTHAIDRPSKINTTPTLGRASRMFFHLIAASLPLPSLCLVGKLKVLMWSKGT